MNPTSSLIVVAILLTTALTVEAQIDTIVRAFVDQASRNSQQRQPQQQQPRANVRASKKLFDGTWLATQAKTNPENQQTINRSFTMIIKDGKATRTLDTTNVST